MYDIATDHAAGLSAALITLAFGFVFLLGLRFLAGRRIAWAIRMTQAFAGAPSITKVAATLMLLSGGIHLALEPSHEGITGLLFVIDGLGLVGFAIAAFLTTWWRRPAVLWLTATIVAYIVWVVAGWEAPDQIGIACKLIELVALGLLMRLANPTRRTWPRRAWRATAFPLMACLTTLGIWVGGLVHPDALHAHAGALLQPVAAVATPEQRAAAARLLADTRASIARYQNPAAAILAGFKPGPVCLRADAARTAVDRRHVPDATRRPVGSRPGRAADPVASARGHLLLPLRLRIQPRDALLDLPGRLDQYHDAADAPRVDHRQRKRRTLFRRPRQDRPAPTQREVIRP
jgi:hypothetical protein